MQATNITAITSDGNLLMGARKESNFCRHFRRLDCEDSNFGRVFRTLAMWASALATSRSMSEMTPLMDSICVLSGQNLESREENGVLGIGTSYLVGYPQSEHVDIPGMARYKNKSTFLVVSSDRCVEKEGC